MRSVAAAIENGEIELARMGGPRQLRRIVVSAQVLEAVASRDAEWAAELATREQR
jgi:hypothetical protein